MMHTPLSLHWLVAVLTGLPLREDDFVTTVGRSGSS